MIIVISVHADDGIFSCGEFIARHAKADEVQVLSLCSIVPPTASAEDGEWQETLNEEHRRACVSLGAKATFAGFSDGKFHVRRDMQQTMMSLQRIVAMERPTHVLIPMGIHHPDHVFFAMAAWRGLDGLGARLAVFEDLPYRVMYPEEAAVLRESYKTRYSAELESAANGGLIEQKLAACRLYESQWGEDAQRCCSVYERIWWVL